MFGALLAAATIAGSIAVPLLPPPQTSAAVLANVTAFNRPCVGFTSTTPQRLAATASAALRSLGWEVASAVGPSFDSASALRLVAPAGAISHMWPLYRGLRRTCVYNFSGSAACKASCKSSISSREPIAKPAKTLGGGAAKKSGQTRPQPALMAKYSARYGFSRARGG